MAQANDIYGQDMHPSVFILEESAARNWGPERLTAALSQHYPDTLEKLCLSLLMYFEIGPTTKSMRMGQALAAALSGAFGTSADFWLNLEQAWLDDPTQPFTQ